MKNKPGLSISLTVLSFALGLYSVWPQIENFTKNPIKTSVFVLIFLSIVIIVFLILRELYIYYQYFKYYREDIINSPLLKECLALLEKKIKLKLNSHKNYYTGLDIWIPVNYRTIKIIEKRHQREITKSYSSKSFLKRKKYSKEWLLRISNTINKEEYIAIPLKVNNLKYYGASDSYITKDYRYISDITKVLDVWKKSHSKKLDSESIDKISKVHETDPQRGINSILSIPLEKKGPTVILNVIFSKEGVYKTTDASKDFCCELTSESCCEAKKIEDALKDALTLDYVKVFKKL